MRRKKYEVEGCKYPLPDEHQPRLTFLEEPDASQFKEKGVVSKHFAFTSTFIQMVAYVTGAGENRCASGLVRALMWRAALR